MFIPRHVYIEEKALHYTVGKDVERFCLNRDIPISYGKSARIKLNGDSAAEKYRHGKGILAVGVRKVGEFQTCKPSAHYQLPLVSGCMGMCEYCYLHTQMGKRPYVKVYANLEEILAKADAYIAQKAPETTIFEGAATSDPLPLEPYTRLLARTILHFAASRYGRFRFVSKFNDVASLLTLDHRHHTEVRVSLNINEVIGQYEHRTPVVELRLEALEKLAAAGYPIGVLIAPVFWQKENQRPYRELIAKIGSMMKGSRMTFEVISHRFTAAAKNNILEVFPETMLPMEEGERKYQYGQFGYGKYVYPPEEMQMYKDFFRQEISKYFSEEQILYII